MRKTKLTKTDKMHKNSLKLKKYAKKVITILTISALIVAGSLSDIKFSKASEYLGYSYFTDNGNRYKVDYNCTRLNSDNEAYGVTINSINQVDNDGNVLELSRDRVLPTAIDLSQTVHSDKFDCDCIIKTIGGEEFDGDTSDVGESFLDIRALMDGNLDATLYAKDYEYYFDMKLSDNIEKINYKAISGVGVNKVVIPESCELIEKEAFDSASTTAFITNPNTILEKDSLNYASTIIGYNNSIVGTSTNKPSNFKSFEDYKKDGGILPSDCKISDKEPIKLNVSIKTDNLHTGVSAKSYENPYIYIIGNSTTIKGAATIDTETSHLNYNYNFTGYYTADGVKIFDEKGNFVTDISSLIDNDTIYAEFTPETYYVRCYNYDNNNGKMEYEYTYGVDYILPIPTLTGYTFINWTNDNDGNIINKIVAGEYGNYNVNGNWKANDYTVTLNCDGGTVDNGEIKHTYAADSVTLPIPKKAGYIFTGWKDSKGNTVTSIDKFLAEDVVYTAQWESDTPVVSPTTEPTIEPTKTPDSSSSSGSNGSSSSSGSSSIVTSTTTPTITPTSTVVPTVAPTIIPTVAPTQKPTAQPTKTPISGDMNGDIITKPTVEPTKTPASDDMNGEVVTTPTVEPTIVPTTEPTAEPTVKPIKKPIKYSKNSVLAKKKTTIGGIAVTRKSVAANKKSAKVKFSWKKVKKADKYTAYVKKGKKWKKIKSSKKNSFIITIKKTSKYKVIAQKKVAARTKGKKKYIYKNIKTLKRTVKFK